MTARLQQRRTGQFISHSSPTETVHTINHPRLPFHMRWSIIHNQQMHP